MTSNDPPSDKARSPRDPNVLPEWADQWMAQWRNAAVKLQEFRDWELRQLGDPTAVSSTEIERYAPVGEDRAAWSGLVIQQRWFMRQRLLELEAFRLKHESKS